MYVKIKTNGYLSKKRGFEMLVTQFCLKISSTKCIHIWSFALSPKFALTTIQTTIPPCEQ